MVAGDLGLGRRPPSRTCARDVAVRRLPCRAAGGCFVGNRDRRCRVHLSQLGAAVVLRGHWCPAAASPCVLLVLHRCGDSRRGLGLFQSKRGAFQARVAGLPAASEPRFLSLESESLGSALTGPIERSFVYDESGRVAGPTPEEAAEFRARFFPSRAAADYCTRFQHVRPLGGHFYVIRGICEFPQ